MRPIDADAAHSKLTELYKNAKGEARRAYSRAIDVICDADTIEEPLKIPDVERVLNETTVFSACFRERITLREFMNKVQKGECNKFRHGRWIPREYDGYADGAPVWDKWECSECGHEHSGEEDTLTAFCPECGARMDGGGTDAG